MVTATVEAHRWTRVKYEQAAAAGVFEDRRVELVDGVIYDMTPQNSPHATGIVKCAEALRAVFSSGFHVRPQLPLALGADSMPEPDFAVVAGKADDYRKAHPATAVLVVEVSDASELHDRNRKASLYARAGIPELWLVNLVRDHLEVHRDPADGAYRSRQVLRRGERIAPLARPDVAIAVEDLLPLPD
jgi:Uma2 family endonuclease